MKFKSDIEVQAGLKDSSGALGTSGQVLSSTGSNVSWINQTTIANDVQNRVKAGVAINKGQAVYVTGADGTNIIVGLASNTTEATSSKTLGLLNATVAINGMADVVQIGRLSGLNTLSATVGDPVWLGTGGNLIYGLINKPYAPAHLVFIGVVTRVNVSNGEIFINVQNGFELNEIHDVDIKTTVPVNGDILGYNGTLWVNKTIAQWLGYTPANASGTTNYVSKFTGTTTLGNSLIYDNGTNVGINNTTPNYALDVIGSASISSNIYTNNVFGLSFGTVGYANSNTLINTYTGKDILFSVNSSEKMRLTAAGSLGIGTSSPFSKMEIVGAATSWSNSPSVTFTDNAGTVNSRKWLIGNVATDYGSLNFAVSTTNSNDPTNPKLTITKEGNVGIGVTAPSQLLHVAGNARITGGIYDSSNAIGSSGQILSSTGSGTSWVTPTTGTITGSGTTNYVTKFTGTSSIGNSQIFDNGTNVGIGTTSPISKLQSTGTFTVGSGIFSSAGTMQLLTGGTSPINNRLTYSTDGTGWKFAIGKNQNGTVTDQFVIQDNGNVGIGTTSPVAISNYTTLDLRGTNGSLLYMGQAGATASLRLIGEGTDAYIDNVNISGGLLFRTNAATERMRITLGGNVGIGTTTPSEKLHVSGGNIIVNTDQAIGWGDRTTQIVGVTGPGGIMRFDVNNAERMRINATGNVGIGTSAPNTKLTVEGVLATKPAGVNAYYSYLRSNWLADNAFELGISDDGISNFHKLITSSNYYNGSTLQFWTNDTERARFDISGNLGIGTTAPSSKLEVAGIGKFTGAGGRSVVLEGGGAGRIDINGDGSVYATGILFNSQAGGTALSGIWNYGSGTSQQWLAIGGTAYNSAAIYILPSGNVGIGASSPASKLHVLSSGGISRFQSSTTTLYTTYVANGVDVGYIGNGTGVASGGSATDFGVQAPNNFVFATGGSSERMRITSAGNVGIGTTSPSQKLEVNGYILSDRYYPKSSNGVYLTGDTGGLVVEGSPGYFYVSAAGGSYFQQVVRFRNTVSNDTGTYLTFGGGTSGITYFTGGARIAGPIYDSSNSAGSSGQVLSSTGSGTAWVTGGGGGGGISGSGSANRIPKFTGATSIGNSLIYDDGTSVGINTTTPGAALDVQGSLKVDSGPYAFLLVDSTEGVLGAQAGSGGFSYAGGGPGIGTSGDSMAALTSRNTANVDDAVFGLQGIDSSTGQQYFFTAKNVIKGSGPSDPYTPKKWMEVYDMNSGSTYWINLYQ